MEAEKVDYTAGVDSIKVHEGPVPAERLGIETGAPVMIRERRYLANGEPVETATSYIPADFARGTPIAENDSGPGGIYARLEDAGHLLDRFVEDVGARMPTPAERRALQLGPGVPVLTVVRSGVQGRALRRGAWSQRVKWPELMTAMRLPGVHFHDLRHAGNIWASKAGISTKDLMSRMGHDDMRAALIYQRATSDADRLIADRLSSLVDEHRGRTTESENPGDGAGGALVPVA